LDKYGKFRYDFVPCTIKTPRLWYKNTNKTWFFPVYLIVILIMILFGYLEDKLGFFSEEARIVTRRNPQMEEILRRLEKIEKKIDNSQKTEQKNSK